MISPVVILVAKLGGRNPRVSPQDMAVSQNQSRWVISRVTDCCGPLCHNVTVPQPNRLTSHTFVSQIRHKPRCARKVCDDRSPTNLGRIEDDDNIGLAIHIFKLANSQIGHMISTIFIIMFTFATSELSSTRFKSRRFACFMAMLHSTSVWGYANVA